MPTIDSKTISVRVSNQLATRVTHLAAKRGLTVNGLMTQVMQAAVDEIDHVPVVPIVPVTEPDKAELEEAIELTGEQKRIYGIALTLVDDLTEAGYPESEIDNAFRGIRRDML